MKISISLPSLYPHLLHSALERIYTTIGSFDVEIVVVSPFEIRGPDIKWVPEQTPQGNCAAHALAYENCSGDVIVTLTDDLLPEPGWLPAILDHLAQGERKNRFFATSLNYFTGKLGTVFGIYYPYMPILSRHTLFAIGGFFSRDYHARFGDADIGLRVWQIGGRCEPCPNAFFIPLEGREDLPESPHKATSLARDTEVFLAKWNPIYGAGWPTESVRDYNIDVFEHVLPYVMKDNTIFMNDPEFARVIYRHYRDLNLSYGTKDRPLR